MTTDLDYRFARRLRLSATLVLLGLAVEIATLVKAHPLTFLSFMIAGIGLVTVGAVTFVWAWLTH
jgi:hypothetical protein